MRGKIERSVGHRITGALWTSVLGLAFASGTALASGPNAGDLPVGSAILEVPDPDAQVHQRQQLVRGAVARRAPCPTRVPSPSRVVGPRWIPSHTSEIAGARARAGSPSPAGGSPADALNSALDRFCEWSDGQGPRGDTLCARTVPDFEGEADQAEPVFQKPLVVRYGAEPPQGTTKRYGDGDETGRVASRRDRRRQRPGVRQEAPGRGPGGQGGRFPTGGTGSRGSPTRRADRMRIRRASATYRTPRSHSTSGSRTPSHPVKATSMGGAYHGLNINAARSGQQSGDPSERRHRRQQRLRGRGGRSRMPSAKRSTDLAPRASWW